MLASPSITHIVFLPNVSIIGVLDADAMIFSYLTEATIMSHDKLIYMRAGPGDNYKMDTVALKEPTPYEFMWVNRFPVWMWRETYQHVRNHIASVWNATFDDAFEQFSSGRFSQFNIMSNYAVQRTPEWYKLVLPNDRRGVVSVGCNICREEDIALGCCVTYGNCSGTENAFLSRYTTYNVTWGRAVTDVYKADLPEFPVDHAGRRACREFFDGEYRPICMNV